MRTIIITAAALLLAGPALAQSNTQSTSQQPSAQQTAGQQSGQDMSRQKVVEQVKKAGFKNARILETSYLVAATTEGGETVLMVVSPAGEQQAEMTGSGDSGGSSGQSGSGSSQQQSQ